MASRSALMSRPTKPRAISVYGESKLRGEQALLETGGEHLVVRVSWVFGPHRPSFVDGVLKRALDSEMVEAIGDKWSTPTYTVDLAAMLHPFLRDNPCGGILHASNTGACTWREYGEYALQCAARAGLPVKTTEVKHVPMASMLAFVAQRPGLYRSRHGEAGTRLPACSPAPGRPQSRIT